VVISDPSKIAAGMLDFAQPPQPEISNDPTNFFDHNVYKLPTVSRFGGARMAGLFWFWGENKGRGPKRVTWADWQASGHDRNGTLVRSSVE
jgi:hypothetical protein